MSKATLTHSVNAIDVDGERLSVQHGTPVKFIHDAGDWLGEKAVVVGIEFDCDGEIRNRRVRIPKSWLEQP